jgi:thiopurine S-methyltransferase
MFAIAGGASLGYAAPMAGKWHDSWREGRIGFHQSDVHNDLVAYEARFLAGGPHRILVPLCGKTVDLIWLAERGHEVVGVELVPQAVDEFFAEQELAATESEVDGLRVVTSGKIQLVNGDFFAVSKAHFGSFDRIWDRAALVALPDEIRGRYVAHLRSLGAPSALVLQNVFEYDQSKMAGPPFSVNDSEVRRHYQGAEIELLSEKDVIAKAPQFQAKGHEYWLTRNYLMTL